MKRHHQIQLGKSYLSVVINSRTRISSWFWNIPISPPPHLFPPGKLFRKNSLQVFFQMFSLKYSKINYNHFIHKNNTLIQKQPFISYHRGNHTYKFGNQLTCSQISFTLLRSAIGSSQSSVGLCIQPLKQYGILLV